MTALTWRWLLVGGAAVGAGALFTWLSLPAAWFLGPLLAAGALAAARPQRLALPRWLDQSALAVVGSQMSVALTPAALPTLARYWLPLLLLLSALLLLSVLAGLLLAHLSVLDRKTALLGMLPGGAPGMIALSHELGADSRLVALMQSVRVMLVIGTLGGAVALVFPLLALPPIAPPPDLSAARGPWQAYLLTLLVSVVGALLGTRIRLPAGALVGPALLGALLSTLGVAYAPWPPLLLNVTYLLIGLDVGVQFTLHTLQTAGRLLPVFVLASLALIGCSALFGVLLAELTSASLLSSYLATSPGGLSVAVVLALESGADVSLVLTLNLLRFLAIALGAPLLVRWLGPDTERA